MKQAMTSIRLFRLVRTIALLAAVALTAAACNWPLPTTPTATPAPPWDMPADWICYQDFTYHFEVCYPAGAFITTASAEHSRIQLNFLSGTTLVDKYMEIDSRAGAADCQSPQADGYDPAAITTKTGNINGNDFFIQSASEGAAGSMYLWEGFSTARDDVCVSLTGVLHSTNPGLFETPPPEYDYAAESEDFTHIVNTFRWLDTATPTPTIAATLAAGWVCYQNTAYAFQVCYPGDATLSEESPAHVRINLSFAPGTNLSEKYMNVDGSNEAAIDCESPQAAGYGPGAVTESDQVFVGLKWRVQSASDHGMGNIYDWTGYSTFRNTGVNACASLTGILHSLQPGNFPTPPPVFDMAAESAVFEQIVDTFRWLDAATPIPTPAMDSAPMATFAENTNCRRGASLQHEIVTYLKKGIRAPIVGRNADSSWWLIRVPGSLLQCWVWSGFVQTSGPLDGIPFAESPVLGCWYRGPRDKKPRCAVPCPEGADSKDVCQP